MEIFQGYQLSISSIWTIDGPSYLEGCYVWLASRTRDRGSSQLLDAKTCAQLLMTCNAQVLQMVTIETFTCDVGCPMVVALHPKMGDMATSLCGDWLAVVAAYVVYISSQSES